MATATSRLCWSGWLCTKQYKYENVIVTRTHHCRVTSETINSVSSTESTSCPAEVTVVEHDERQRAVCDENRLERVGLRRTRTTDCIDYWLS